MPYPTKPHALARVPFEAVVGRLKSHPGMIEHLEGIDLDGDGVPDFPLGPPPLDPAGRMQWQAVASQRRNMAQTRARNASNRKAVNNQRLLAYLQAHDPLFPHVKRFIDSFVESLPGKLKQAVLESVDRKPGTFLEMYEDLRKHIIQEFGLSGEARAVMHQTFPGQAGPRPPFVSKAPHGVSRSAITGRMSPPPLERAGIMDDRLPGASRAAELAALKARCKAGKAREGDLLRYLELNWRGGDD